MSFFRTFVSCDSLGNALAVFSSAAPLLCIGTLSLNGIGGLCDSFCFGDKLRFSIGSFRVCSTETVASAGTLCDKGNASLSTLAMITLEF